MDMVSEVNTELFLATNSLTVKYKFIQPELVTGPYFVDTHEDDAGIDLRLYWIEDCEPDEHGMYMLETGTVYVVHTNIAFAIPSGYEGLLSLRSSMGKRGFIVTNAPGIIDSSYRGECIVLLYLLPGRGEYMRPSCDGCVLRGRMVEIGAKERIAQLRIRRKENIYLRCAEELDETVRGSGGFGSTGKY